MAQAATLNMRVDYVAVHWYDWGNPTAAGANDSLTAVGAFNRFKTKLDFSKCLKLPFLHKTTLSSLVSYPIMQILQYFLQTNIIK